MGSLETVAEFNRAERLDGIELSEIVQISEHAARLRAEGVDVIALSTGEPDFPTPSCITEAAVKAIREGKIYYTASVGLLELREAIAEHFLQKGDLHRRGTDG